MPIKKMDPHLLAQKENDGSELKSIARRYKVPIKVLRAILAEMKANGEHPRSMDDVKAELERRDYVYHPRKVKMKMPEDTEAPVVVDNVHVNG